MRIRRFRKEDAESTSRCIIRTLKETTARYYPKRIIDGITKESQPKQIAKRALERHLLVVEDKDKIIGTINLTKDGWISTFFIEPKYQGKGIGTKLLASIERIAKNKKIKTIRTHCTINSVDFYKKNGYLVVKQVVFKNYGRTYRLFKRI
ncbi:MAG: GNAT family N-acetyltransferase [Candidatus Micrarchaeota archaeon]